MTRIPITFHELQPIAVKASRAGELLGVSRWQIWKLNKTHQIEKLSCGTYAISELQRYANTPPAKVEKPQIVRKRAA